MPQRFRPWKPLLEGIADAECRSVVIIPARNEEATLGLTLDALAVQLNLDGTRVSNESFEILLLLNNCSDHSAQTAYKWQRENPDVRLHIVEITLQANRAFVGTARRMLMDTAWRRLKGRKKVCGILSTDSDTVVHQHWLASTMKALDAGADAVGGAILLKPGELQRLPSGVRRAYLRDRRYQRLVAELEHLLDPQAGDPWPRHLEHFGASLACTPEIYARSGGMPPVTPLEDVAFVDRLRRAGAKLRHDPEVMVYTSSRMEGRVKVGLSGQLTIWREMSEKGDEHSVQSAAWLAHRFRTLNCLRREAALKLMEETAYLAKIDCDQRIRDTFRGGLEGEITWVNRRLRAMITNESKRCSLFRAGVAVDQDGNADSAVALEHTTQGGSAIFDEPHPL